MYFFPLLVCQNNFTLWLFSHTWTFPFGWEEILACPSLKQCASVLLYRSYILYFLHFGSARFLTAAAAFCLKWGPILPCPDGILRVTGHSPTTSHGNSRWVPLDCSHQDLTQEAEPCLSPLSQAVVTLLLKLPPMGWAKNAPNNPLCSIIPISPWANSHI